MPAEPQRRDAEPGAGEQRERHAGGEAEPERQVVIDRAEPHRIGAEREERGLREIDLAAKPEHDREAEHRDGVGRRLHQDVGDIAVGLHARGERDRDDRGEGVGDVGESEAAHRAHAFSATRSPKIPCGRMARKRISTRNANASLKGTEI